jgi:Alginate lyase
MMQLNRRAFCRRAAAAACFTHFAFADTAAPTGGYALVARTDRARILAAAIRYLDMKPRTITSYPTSRSPGGIHDYFSQADYFWPNPQDPGGKYINRDGQSNPENFNDHRKAMIALSIEMPALTAAWLLTGDRRYGQLAGDHLRAWFIDPDTCMNPNLEYSQGVHGVSTGRSYGIIDTLHLVEVARAASIIAPTILASSEQQALHNWFRAYLHWMKTSEKGIAERDTVNNHAVCWALQAAEFARLIDDQETREEVRTQFKTLFVPGQMALDGSFPKELARTKPYSYSIFNFDILATLCQSLQGDGPSLYSFVLPDGRGICKAAAFLYPYLRDKGTWPYKQDIEHFASLPVRSPGLLFSGLACHHQEYLQLWTKLNPDPTDPEIIRNYPIRQPLLWVNQPSRSKRSPR